MEEAPQTPEQLRALAEYQRYKDLAAGILIGGQLVVTTILGIRYWDKLPAFITNLF